MSVPARGPFSLVLHALRRLRPSALGPGFRSLWSASAITNLGDGALLAAGPLLVSAISREPLAVAGAVVAQQLPWLLFALVSGALVDCLDRRRIVVGVNLARALVLALLATVIGLDVVALPMLYLGLFLLGIGETFADTASSALLVRVVPCDDLGRANARLFATFTLGNQLAGPPLGAALFVARAALPFAVHAAAFLLAALLITRIPLTAAPEGTNVESGPEPLRRQISAGLRWLWQHRGLRMLALSIAVMNLTFMAAFATWVLYAREILGLMETQFGLLLTAGALGGLVGSSIYARLEAGLAVAVQHPSGCGW